MNVFLFYDYELFIGAHPGRVQKCVLEHMRQVIHLWVQKLNKFRSERNTNLNFKFFYNLN
jgi:hypothetical protein